MQHTVEDLTQKSTSVTAGDGKSIQYQSISKGFDSRPVLQDVSFKLPGGKILALVGPSGCGKTTLLKLLNKLERPDRGNIFIDNVSIETIPDIELRSRIGYVVQHAGLFPHLTVQQNISLMPRLRGWSSAQITERIASLFDLVRLDSRQVANSYPATLSGGQQQRVGIARALAMDPGLLLMDEPFGALDPGLRRDLQAQFRELQSSLGKTVIIVTHDMEEAVFLADYIAVMSPLGQLLQIDRTRVVQEEPASPAVAQLFQSISESVRTKPHAMNSCNTKHGI